MSLDIFPTGILKNTALNRFHPILFRMAPMPGGVGLDSSVCRYKSYGHHTEGFETLELAEKHIADNFEKQRLYATGVVWDWDGKDVPAIVTFFAVPKEPRGTATPT